MDCLTNLVGVKELCQQANAITPLFYLDDMEGVDRTALAQLAKASNGSGLAFGNEIIESASRFLMADIETLIPKGYSIKSYLNSFCNTCTYTNTNSITANTGIIVKNISTTKNGYLSIDSLKVMIASTGTYTIVLDDGVAPKQIAYDFTAGTEVVITNILYKTSSKSVKIYFLEPGVLVTALNCPTTKSCGCSGRKADSSTDLQVKGLLGDAEFTTQYGFVPCASVVCSIDNVLCSIVNQQPKLFALALFYRAAARYFSEFQTTQRNNRNASFDEEEKLSLADRYIALYYERLRGSQNVKGISDNMAAALNNLNDSCVECIRPVSTSWAIS
jgi:hypothetical protein